MFVSNAARRSSMIRVWANHSLRLTASLLTAVAVLLTLSGCERRLGKLKSHEVREMGAFRFLVTRSDVPYYGKELSKTYWCSTAATRKNRPAPAAHMLDATEPQIFKGAGDLIFGGHGDTEGSGDEKKDFLDIHVVDDLTAYYTTGLVATFDACVTRVYFNVSSGARFEDTMRAFPIRYPDANMHFGTPFFSRLELRPQGGCFAIEPSYVDTAQRFFYCTADQGRTWRLESPIGTVMVMTPEADEAAKVARKEANTLVFCVDSSNPKSSAHMRKQDCDAKAARGGK